MKMWNLKQWTNTTKRRIAASALALAMVGSFTAYEVMKPVTATAATSTATAASPIDASQVDALLALDHAMETVAARVTPSIVNVAVTAKVSPQQAMSEGQDQGGDDNGNPLQQFFGPMFQGPNGPGYGQRMQPRIEHGIGTGVIISPDGYIVTNNHVVQGATDVRVTLNDRRILPAKVIGADPLTDLAVIKVEGSNFPAVPWGDSGQLHPGQTVLAFGNPYGFRFTVTRGIVSALNRPNPEADARKPGQYIQTDAAINPGNSGGPLVNARGEVVGINTFLISPSGSFAGMGFAIPTQIVQPTVAQLMKSGKVEHGYMGVGISDVTPENAKFFDMKSADGAVVTEVTPGAPGDKAGLKTGDVITGMNGENVTTAGELQMKVQQQQPGSTIKLAVMRDGKEMTVPVTVEQIGGKGGTERASAENGKPRWGVGIGDLDNNTRQQIQAPSQIQGAVVEKVVPGSPADNAGLQPGDVIESVNRKPTPNASAVKDALGSISNGESVMLRVWSNGGSTFRVLHPSEG
jgi:serine protease Do